LDGAMGLVAYTIWVVGSALGGWCVNGLGSLWQGHAMWRSCGYEGLAVIAWCNEFG